LYCNRRLDGVEKTNYQMALFDMRSEAVSMIRIRNVVDRFGKLLIS